MSNKQARLISAVADAMLSQGFSQSNLARTSGVAQSMISAALLGKYDLKEEKWRLLCEVLALDYDDIIAEPDVLTESACTDKETPCEGGAEQEAGETLALQPEADCSDDSRRRIEVDFQQAKAVAEYLEQKLREDIAAGTAMSLENLYALLTHARVLKGE